MTGEKRFTIYKMTDRNGMSYVGCTSKSLENRMSGHRNAATRATKGGISEAIRNLGFQSFLVEVLAVEHTAEAAAETETKMILTHKSFAPNGYNKSSVSAYCGSKVDGWKSELLNRDFLDLAEAKLAIKKASIIRRRVRHRCLARLARKEHQNRASTPTGSGGAQPLAPPD